MAIKGLATITSPISKPLKDSGSVGLGYRTWCPVTLQGYWESPGITLTSEMARRLTSPQGKNSETYSTDNKDKGRTRNITEIVFFTVIELFFFFTESPDTFYSSKGTDHSFKMAAGSIWVSVWLEWAAGCLAFERQANQNSHYQCRYETLKHNAIQKLKGAEEKSAKKDFCNATSDFYFKKSKFKTSVANGQ